MKASVDADACTGCGLCTEICPEVFEMGDEAAKARDAEIPADAEEKAKEAAASCPVQAITVE
jgi:ferredoxin